MNNPYSAVIVTAIIGFLIGHLMNENSFANQDKSIIGFCLILLGFLTIILRHFAKEPEPRLKPQQPLLSKCCGANINWIINKAPAMPELQYVCGSCGKPFEAMADAMESVRKKTMPTPPQSLDAIVEKWSSFIDSYTVSDTFKGIIKDNIRAACEEHAKELQSQLTAERERVKELEKDKERMDWIENQSAMVLAIQVGVGLMLRPAIDSAIARQKGEKV